MDIGSSFTFLQFFHIHRSYNSVADTLSKAGLSKDQGILYVEEYKDGDKITNWSTVIF